MAQREPEPERPLTASVEKLRQELDRWLEYAVTQGERAMDALRPRATGRWVPAVDVVETPEEVLVAVDLPGADPKAVEVSLAGNMLTLSGVKPVTPTEPGHVFHLGERSGGPFSRAIPLPAPVNPDVVSAEAQDGVLRIRLSKAERAKARHIPVKVEEKPTPLQPPFEGGSTVP